MPELSFELDWVEADTVQGAELSATWALFVMRVGDSLPTRVFDHRAKTVRDGVYVPVYPFAEWLATNWWFLVSETENPDKIGDAAFNRRHALRCAKEGYAFPDVEFVSSGAMVRLTWRPAAPTWTRLEFLGGGEVWVEKQQFQDACSILIDQVIRRLVSLGVDDSLLQEEWAAVQTTDAQEAAFCAVTAGLGWDPYAIDDPERKIILGLEGALAGAVLEEAVPILHAHSIDADLGAIRAALDMGRSAGLALDRIGQVRAAVVADAMPASLPTSWAAGFRLAGELRRHLNLDGQPLPSLHELGAAIGERPDDVEEATRHRPFTARLMDGVVTTRADGTPGFAIRHKSDEARRFHFCRGLAEFLTSPNADALLTRAGTDRQKLTRAFAAEFLAPSGGLRERITRPVIDADDVAELAADFGVSPWVVQHQVENHRIAVLG